VDNQRLEHLLQREIEARRTAEENLASERHAREQLDATRSKMMVVLSDSELEKTRVHQELERLGL
jgi:hypothetical protein